MKKIICVVFVVVIALGCFSYQKFNSHEVLESQKDLKKELQKVEAVKDDIIDVGSVEITTDIPENVNTSTPNVPSKNENDKVTSKTSTTKTPNNNSNNNKSTNKSNNSTTTKADSSNNTTKSHETNNTKPTTNNESTNQSQTNKTEITKVSTVLYEQVTHGLKEFSSESEATARGLEIKEKELDYVIEYNATHDNEIQPDIINIRIYPSVIDENGKTWYYLHFICHSGHGNDEKLKSMY